MRAVQHLHSSLKGTQRSSGPLSAPVHEARHDQQAQEGVSRVMKGDLRAA